MNTTLEVIKDRQRFKTGTKHYVKLEIITGTQTVMVYNNEAYDSMHIDELWNYFQPAGEINQSQIDQALQIRIEQVKCRFKPLSTQRQAPSERKEEKV